MRIDFRNMGRDHIKAGSVFFLYGNYKKIFEVFCDFILEVLHERQAEVDVHFCSVAESLKIINGECDLFETKINCFFIKNVEDAHLEKVVRFFDEKNGIFVLESGNYLKSKKITDYFLKSSAMALPSFRNDETLHSFGRMFLPGLTPRVYDEIVRIINGTDEELSSIFRKISILLDGGSWEDLKNYSTYKRSFLSGLGPIPLTRFLLQTIIKEKIAKSANFYKINASNEDAVHHLLQAELKQKFGLEISRGYIYQGLISDRGHTS
jgi:hypothetical protein